MLPMECLRTILFVIVVKMVNSSYRKIKDGKKIDESMRYMVYLLRAEKSETLYDAWLCGGAIVSPDFIVTSAACVKDVQYMYAIAGYSKYVNVKDINENACTKASKKKIVFVCVPRGYELDYARVEKWAYIDIAVAQVESPYDFSSPVVPGCSWVPNQIKINYNKKYQSANTDAMVLGWGHTAKYRKPNDTKDYNQQELQYSSIQVMNKAECKKMYKKTPALFPVIDKYMICAMNEGNLDDRGDSIKRPGRILADGCPRGARRVGDECLPSGPLEYQYQEKSHSYDYLDGLDSYEYQHDPSVDNPVRNDPNRYQEKKPLVDNPVRTNLNGYQDSSVPTLVRKKPNEYQNQFKSSSSYNSFRTNPNQNPDPPDDNLDEYDYQEKSQNVDNPTSINPNKNTNPNEYQNPSVRTSPQGQHQNPPDDDDIITFEDIILGKRRSDKNENKNFSNIMGSRKAGICQNDHGGPLVTWIGKIERLIGVASVFRLDKSLSCVGPYLFTSTQCNGGFLDCVISGYYEEIKNVTEIELPDNKTTAKPATKPTTESEEETTTTKSSSSTTTTTMPKTTTTTTEKTTTTETTETTTTTEKTTTTIYQLQYRDNSPEDHRHKYDEMEFEVLRRSRAYCNLPPRERGFDVIRRRISWMDHPDGPAANELENS